MLERIFTILFPLFAIAALGYAVSCWRKPDMSESNSLMMDVFAPALIFSALSSNNFHIAEYFPLMGATVLLIASCGVFGWGAARIMKISPIAAIPTMMFNNCGNLGIPLALFTFGEDALAPAIVMFMVTSLVQFSFGAWLLDRNTRLISLWKIPTVFATIAGMMVSLMSISIWPPLQTSIKMVGEIVVPLMLFSLGVRISGSRVDEIGFGILGGFLRPAVGALAAATIALVLGLPPKQVSMLILYGALPPAVINLMFAERYQREPGKVASMVFLGHFVSLITLPIALAWILGH
ncbi:MAG: AEC family transporter [Rhodocyclaceae bacterium]|nr:MAG: AEC family transporter [Rhodocyclaceae bacterium]